MQISVPLIEPFGISTVQISFADLRIFGRDRSFSLSGNSIGFAARRGDCRREATGLIRGYFIG